MTEFDRSPVPVAILAVVAVSFLLSGCIGAPTGGTEARTDDGPNASANRSPIHRRTDNTTVTIRQGACADFDPAPSGFDTSNLLDGVGRVVIDVTHDPRVFNVTATWTSDNDLESHLDLYVPDLGLSQQQRGTSPFNATFDLRSGAFDGDVEIQVRCGEEPVGLVVQKQVHVAWELVTREMP